MLEELDQIQTVKSFSAEILEETPLINAVNVRNRQRSNFRGSISRSRGYAKPGVNNRGAINTRSSLSSSKFCRICNLAGSGPQIYLSHEIGECGRLSQRDLDSIKNALVLNGLVSVTDDALPDTSYSSQPGWDDHEEDQSLDDQNQD